MHMGVVQKEGRSQGERREIVVLSEKVEYILVIVEAKQQMGQS